MKTSTMLALCSKARVFFINGTLFTDTRHKGATDYSYWPGDYLARRAPQKIKSRTPQQIQETKIGSLLLDLNQPCAYLHQGDCEHRVTFTGVRLYDKNSDCMFREGYPVRSFEPSTKVTMCQTCLVSIAGKLIFNSALLPSNPMHLCKMCFNALLYDVEGERMDDDDFVHFDFQDVF
eukprot:Lankesteria_metandrocarpae@DN4587_c0_g1_i3.p1